MFGDGKCATCKHWGPDAKGRWHRACRRVLHDAEDAIYWDLKDMDWLSRSEQQERLKQWGPMQSELAVVQDGSGYKATLYTRAEFGCVLHEAAPE
jgi:hypothetical protein